MPTTNISQIISDVIGSVHYLHLEMLSSKSLSTRDLSYARVDYISRFLQEYSLEFKYIILDETVMKRRGKRIENLGSFYSTIENRIVSGVSLLSAMGWVKDKLYFFLFSSTSFQKHVELVQLAFTTWMIANFYRSVKDRVSLRDFLELIKFDYFFQLARSSSVADSSIHFLLPRFVNSKRIS